MNKRTLLFAISSLLVAGSAFASPQKLVKEKYSPEKALADNVVSFNGKKLKLKHHINSAATRDEGSGPVVTPVITNPPGSADQYIKESTGIANDWLLGMYLYQGSNPSTVVWDGEDVYIKDIISDVNVGTYVKGKISGEKITVELPQTIVYYDDMEFGYNLVMMKIYYYIDEEDGEEYVTYILDDSINSIDFIMGDEGDFYMDLPGGFEGDAFPEHALGLVFTDVDPEYDGEPVGFCDFRQEYAIFDMEVNELPEGLELEPYAITIEETGQAYVVNVGFNDDNVYFQGLSEYIPESVVIGKMIKDEDNGYYTVKISQDQYLGLFDEAYFIFTKAVTINPDYDEDDPDSVYVSLAPEDVDVELIYDPSSKSFTYADTPYYLCLNTSLNSIYYLEVFEEIDLKYQSSAAGVPQNPKDLRFIPFSQFYGYDVFDFTIPNISTDDAILGLDNLYYSIFVDGEIMEFMEEPGLNMAGNEVIMYKGITQPTDVLPLTFSNDGDIWTSGNLGEIGIYFTGFTTLGVQSIYIFDGVTTKSSIMEYNIETGEVNAGIQSIDIDNPTVVDSEFYDLSGNRISRPDKGIYIIKLRLSNGATIVRKVAR